MQLAAVPPAFVKRPPAYRLPPDPANAYTLVSIPEPSADQPPLPHLAIRLAVIATPSLLVALLKTPPAYRSLSEAASALTRPSTPKPSADQLFAFHLAM